MNRKVIAIISFIILTSGFCYSQEIREKKLNVVIELNQFITGSGFSSGTRMNIMIESNRNRNLAFGIIYDYEYQKIVGLSAHHETMLWRNRDICKGMIKPCLFYNFLYRKTTIPELGTDLKSKVPFVTYSSHEHHFGIGIRMEFLDRLYMDADIGYGIYLGSIKKPAICNHLTGEVGGTNGFGIIAQVGIGYCIL